MSNQHQIHSLDKLGTPNISICISITAYSLVL